MRLSDFVHETRRRINEVGNVIQHPQQVASQQLRRKAQRLYEQAEIPGQRSAKPRSTQTNTTISLPASPEVERDSSASLPIRLEPLKPPAQRQQVESDQKSSPHKKSPELRNRWGNCYTLGACLGTDQGVVLHEGSNKAGERVLIKEYRLSELGLNTKEIAQREKAFEQIVNLNLRLSSGPDFRIINILDAIVDSAKDRCYLIMKPLPDAITLAQDLAEQGPMLGSDIREVLRQVLETLRFLHEAYRVQFVADTSEIGLVHGNLSLHSLLTRSPKSKSSQHPRFFIYVSDLALWEHLFKSTTSQPRHSTVAKRSDDLGTVAQDLDALGCIACELAGASVDPDSGDFAELYADRPWRELEDEPLRHFIRQLIESSFKTAGDALEKLKQLPTEQLPNDLFPQNESQQESSANQSGQWAPGCIFGLLALLGIGGLAGLAGIGFLTSPTKRAQNPKSSPTPQSSPAPETYTTIAQAEIPAETPSTIRYAINPGSAWASALEQTFRINQSGNNGPTRPNLMELIVLKRQDSERQIKELKPIQHSSENTLCSLGKNSSAIAKVRAKCADVALVRFLPNHDLPSELDKAVVARDAIVVFVPAIDPYGAKKTIGQLNGSISLKDIKQLYTGSSISQKLGNNSFKIFFPEPEGTTKKESNTASKINQQLTINIFRSLLIDGENSESFFDLQERYRKTISNEIRRNIYEQMRVEYFASKSDEDSKVVSIGFDRLSRMYGQCSVYPLAIRPDKSVSSDKSEPSKAQQVLTKSNKSIDEKTDLCDKGSYWPDLSRYPSELTYDLGIVYRKGDPTGEAVKEILTTDEGQYLLYQAGLVPSRKSIEELKKSLE